MDKQSVIKLKSKLEMLSRGIDPVTNVKYSEDVSLNNWENRLLFNEVVQLLDEILDNKLFQSDKRKKKPFILNSNQIKDIDISDKPISISAFVHSINLTHSDENMKKLKASDVTSWLEKQGYLSEIEYYNGCYCRKLTEKSHEIGLSQIKRQNQYGNDYNVIIYNRKAQEYIISHLSDISEFIIIKTTLECIVL